VRNDTNDVFWKIQLLADQARRGMTWEDHSTRSTNTEANELLHHAKTKSVVVGVVVDIQITQRNYSRASQERRGHVCDRVDSVETQSAKGKDELFVDEASDYANCTVDVG